MTAGSAASLMRLLSHPGILSLFLAIRERPAPLADLLGSSPATAGTTHNQLGQLRAAQLVASRGRKLGATYRLTDAGERIAGSLDRLLEARS